MAARAQLATFETVNLRLVYIDPNDNLSSFLTPPAPVFLTGISEAACRLRSPSDEITLLLTDFSDTGNASAYRCSAQRPAVSPLRR